jgi:hypothetical protein
MTAPRPPTTRRRRFSEREVIETLWHQGVNIPCRRCGQIIRPEARGTDGQFHIDVEREHIHEIALGGPDIPANCRYVHRVCHAQITNGTKATTAGSSKHRIAKTKPHRTRKFQVNKEIGSGGFLASHSGEKGADRETVLDAAPDRPKRKFPKRHNPWNKRQA